MFQLKTLFKQKKSEKPFNLIFRSKYQKFCNIIHEISLHTNIKMEERLGREFSSLDGIAT